MKRLSGKINFRSHERRDVPDVSIVVISPCAALSFLRGLAYDTPVAENGPNLIPVHDGAPPELLTALAESVRSNGKKRDTQGTE
jgi:hypothetical protein